MPTSILPPLPTTTPNSAPDVDSLAARQARNLEQVTTMTATTSAAMLAGVRDTYLHAWGQPRKVPQLNAQGKPVLDAAGKPVTVANPADRANENNLSPADAVASMGTGAQAAFTIYAATLAAVHSIYGDAAMVHPVTSEDMSRAPVGWTVTFATDGSGTATYTPPAPAA